MPRFPEMRDSYKDFSRIKGVLEMSIFRAKIAFLLVSGDNSLLCSKNSSHPKTGWDHFSNTGLLYYI